MKIIIAGSRTITDVRIVAWALGSAGLKLGMISEIVSGGAKGVDTLGEQIAIINNIPVRRFPADWNKYGRSAGYKRNAEMAEYADILVAVWDGQSKGTEHMVDLMQRGGKGVHVHVVRSV